MNKPWDEEALADDTAHYTLRLFISGMTPRSTAAIENLKAICERELAGRYELEIIDVYQQPELAKSQQIVAMPTLIKVLPEPVRILIGDLSEESKVLVGLDLRPRT